ncbi:D-glucuronyl C5-epimerase family protein [Micromonospora sp. NPDC023956]|uniref:D-glucuronyl C5-epimerase family protein n=1 Tax=Micromonospora sp. NPDC023956 TaxID=3155722 RepID=UPI003411D18A
MEFDDAGPDEGRLPAWSRRAVLGTGLVAGTGLVTGTVPMRGGPAVAAVPGPRWVTPTASVVDPAHELSPPLPGDQIGRAPRVSGSRLRALTPKRRSEVESSAPGEGRTFSPSSTIPFQFRYDDFEIRDLPTELRPYYRATPVPLVDTGTHDAEGVRTMVTGGRMHDHPVAQAQYGIALLESHRLTGNVAYLERAIKQAQRLVDRRKVRDAAWFYPYGFDYALHAVYDLFRPPWYSCMAQGQALSLFVRLHEVTGNSSWRTAADATFASFLLPPVAGKPWGVWTVDGLLWLEEYPYPNAVKGDRTYNGHMFAAFGLWDYWRLTGNTDAKLLLQGALTTARDAYGAIRNRNWRSKYCLLHARDSGNYHTTHSIQHVQLYGMTGDEYFARIADLYYTDFPPIGVKANVRMTPGTHTAYKFSSTGSALGSRNLTLTRNSTAPCTERQRVSGRSGIWYAISAGTFAGYHLQETRGARYAIGVNAAMTYLVPRLGTVVPASLVSYSIDANGAMASAPTGLVAGDQAAFDMRAVLNGVEHLRLASGDHAGRWVGYSTITPAS